MFDHPNRNTEGRRRSGHRVALHVHQMCPLRQRFLQLWVGNEDIAGGQCYRVISQTQRITEVFAGERQKGRCVEVMLKNHSNLVGTHQTRPQRTSRAQIEDLRRQLRRRGKRTGHGDRSVDFARAGYQHGQVGVEVGRLFRQRHDDERLGHVCSLGFST